MADRYPRDEYENEDSRGRGYERSGGAEYGSTPRGRNDYGGRQRASGEQDYGERSYGDRGAREGMESDWRDRDYGGRYGQSLGGRGAGDRSDYGRGYNSMQGYRQSDYQGGFSEGMAGNRSMTYREGSMSYGAGFGGQPTTAQSGRTSASRGQHTGKGPKGYARSDERITEDVNDALTEDGQLDASDIEVKVADGVVTLSGEVESREAKRRAEDLADAITGVKEVQNQLRLQQEKQKTSSGASRKSAH